MCHDLSEVPCPGPLCSFLISTSNTLPTGKKPFPTGLTQLLGCTVPYCPNDRPNLVLGASRPITIILMSCQWLLQEWRLWAIFLRHLRVLHSVSQATALEQEPVGSSVPAGRMSVAWALPGPASFVDMADS